MSAPIIQAQYEALDEIAKQFNRQASNTETMLRLLIQRLEQLEGGGWIGESAQSFFHEMGGEVIPATNRLRDAFSAGNEATINITQILQAAEQEAAKPFQNNSNLPSYITKLGKNIRINPDDPSYTVKNGVVFKSVNGETSVHPNDIQQQGLGDCYLMASMATIADQNPNLLQNAIKDNGDGTYTVTLYKKQGGFLGIGGEYKPVEITVTGEFPNGQYYSKNEDKWIDYSVHAGVGDQELWPRLIEKAYGQMESGSENLNDQYKTLVGGFPEHALTALTGIPTQTYSPDKFTVQELAELHNNGNAITLTSKTDWGPFTDNYYNNDTLVRSHVYWIDSVNESAGTVTIRNPWGYNNQDKNLIIMPIDELGDNFRQMEINPTK